VQVTFSQVAYYIAFVCNHSQTHNTSWDTLSISFSCI